MLLLSSSTFIDLLRALVEHPKAPELFAVLLGFLAALIGYFIKLKLTRTNTAFEQYNDLLKKLRTEKSVLIARKQQLIENLEECADQLNKVEAGKELLSNELEKCKKTLEDVRNTL